MAVTSSSSSAALVSLTRSSYYHRSSYATLSSISSVSLPHHNNIQSPLHFRTNKKLSARKSLQISGIGGDSKTKVVTSKSWDKLILESNTPVLVEFYASWCGPCRMVHRVIDEIAHDYSGRLTCFVIDADKDSKMAEMYDIKAVPVVLVFKNGEKCESITGTMPKEFYVAAIERVFAS